MTTSSWTRGRASIAGVGSRTPAPCCRARHGRRCARAAGHRRARRRGGLAGERGDRAADLDASRQPEPMHLADHRVAGDAQAELRRRSGWRSSRRATVCAKARRVHRSKTLWPHHLRTAGRDRRRRAPPIQRFETESAATRVERRAGERHAPKRSHEGPPHDMSWFDAANVTLLVESRAESAGARRGLFPQAVAGGVARARRTGCAADWSSRINRR